MFWLLCNVVWLDSSQPNKGLDLSWYYLKRNSTKQLNQNRALPSQQFSICKQRQSTYSIKIPSKPQPDLSGPEWCPVAFVQDMNINHTHTAQEGLDRCTDKVFRFYFTQIAAIWPSFRSFSAAVFSIFCCASSSVLGQQSTPAWWIRACQGLTLTWMPSGKHWMDGTVHINQCTLFLLENTVVHKHKPFFIITTNC